MSDVNKSHFSNRLLHLSEHAQHGISHTGLGRRATKIIAGSTLPNYRQLDWRSLQLDAEITEIISVPGDPDASWLARNWRKAIVIAAPTSELIDLRTQIGDGEPEQAVAYVVDNTFHVGVNASESSMFHELNDEETAVAMRLGRGSLRATMGLWLPNERTFRSVEHPRLVEPAILLGSLVIDYPNILFT